MTLSLYQPGNGVLHRLSAGTKLAALLVFGVLIAVTDHLGLALIFALMGTVAVLSSGAPRDLLVRQATGIALIAALVIAANVLFASAREGLLFALRVAGLVSASAAVTFTTRTDAILDLIDRGLSRFGRPGRIASDRLGIMIALVIRFVPELFAHARALDEARRARGLEVSALRLITPLLVRTLRTADDVAAALEARGYPRDD